MDQTLTIMAQQLRRTGSKAVDLRAESNGTEKVIRMYGPIGSSIWEDGITANAVADLLDGPETSVVCNLNSPGGSMFEGATIYNLLRSSGKTIRMVVEGMAASAASLITMAGDTIEMRTGSMMMIHEARAAVYGPAKVMRTTADLLAKASDGMADIYATARSKPKDEVAAIMAAETWMTADEAVEKGFATARVAGDSALQAIAREYNLSAVYEKTPDDLKVFEPKAAVSPDQEASLAELPNLIRALCQTNQALRVSVR